MRWLERRNDKEVFKYLGSEDCFFEQEPIRNLAKDNQLAVYEHNGFWVAIDTIKDVQKERYCGGWNFGPEDHSIVKVEEVISAIIKNWGVGKWVDLSSSEEFHEANLLLDISKAKTYLNWKSVWDMAKCIQMTVDWYKRFSEHNNMYDFCKNQISFYEKCVYELGGY
ncbi:hypothetical protein [Clostridium estertheticum]|uniref:hypothetical protein n=1 Tax=Clostridium estertheticum TaxID=238834 RepID=UPI001C0D3F62|nr:hypothetical protein [Clostridium estertheticum]MBU3076084.1 hypothetical protein [Clostridium estertheticum]MBU3166192.1 hypothetical protein [Clostridium estertheticum]